MIKFLKKLFSFRRFTSLNPCPYPVKVWVVFFIRGSEVNTIGVFFDYYAALDCQSKHDSSILDYAIMSAVELTKPIEFL